MTPSFNLMENQNVDLCAVYKAQIAMFLALGGASGRATLQRACDLLADDGL